MMTGEYYVSYVCNVLGISLEEFENQKYVIEAMGIAGVSDRYGGGRDLYNLSYMTSYYSKILNDGDYGEIQKIYEKYNKFFYDKGIENPYFGKYLESFDIETEY